MILAPYALQVLPANRSGMALIFVALALFMIDLKVLNHGLPTVGGIAACALGVLMLFDPTTTYLFLAGLIVLVAVGILIATVFVGGLSDVITAKGRPVVTGVEGMIGEVGVVRGQVGSSFPGWVFVHGELWQAIAAVAPEDAHRHDHQRLIRVGDRVQVVDLRDGKVVVVPFKPVALGCSEKG